MPKDRPNHYLVIPCNNLPLAKPLAACLAVIACGLLINAAAEAPATSGRDLPQQQRNAAEDMKTAVIGWMKTRSEMPEQVLASIYDEAALRSVSADLVLAICAVESSFNPGVKSHKGALGLMGISSHVWLEELKGRGLVTGRRDLFLIPNNIAAGTYVLEKYLARSGSLEQALRDYVGGDGYYAGKIMQALGEIYLAKMPARPSDVNTAAAGQPPAEQYAYR